MPGTTTNADDSTRLRKRDLAWIGAKEIKVLLGVGAGALARIAGALVLLGIGLAVASNFVAGHGFWWRLLLVVVALAAGLVEGVILGMHYALAAIIVGAVQRYHIAGHLLGVLFAGIERYAGQTVTGAIRRVPLQQLETAVRQTTAGWSGEDVQAGWFQRLVIRRLYRKLMKWVTMLTLAEFRRADAVDGGIELPVVRERLAARIDALVKRRVLGSIRQLTWIVAAATALVILAASMAVRLWE